MRIHQHRFIFLALVAAIATFGRAGTGQSNVPVAARFTYGGDGADTVHAVTTDAVGNIYIAGRTTSRNLPGTEHGFQKTLRGAPSYGGVTDGFVAKLSPDGRVIWATYLGGNDARMPGGKLPTSADEAKAIAVDAEGNVYVAGTTGSTDFPTTPNAFQPQPQAAASGFDGFFAKVKADGTGVSYSTYIGAPDRSTTAAAISVGRNRDAWVLVGTTSLQFPWTHDLSGGAGSAYLGHVLADGTLASWTRVGSGGDVIAGLAVDRLGRPHVLTHWPPPNAGVALTQLDDTGTRANFSWLLPLGGAVPTPSADLAIGSDGTIVIVGLAAGPLPVIRPFQPEPGGNGDAFVAALNPQGVPEVLSYLGGSGAERTRPRVTVDGDQLHIALDTGSIDLRTERGLIPHHPDSPLHTSPDNGRSWNRAGSGLTGTTTDFAFDSGRDVAYTLSDGVVLRSTDRGATWQEVRRIEPFGNRGRIAIDPRDPTTVYAGERNLYRLDRSGETVTQLRETTSGVGGFRVDSIAVSPHDSSVWIGTGNGVEVSFDRGVSWERRANGLPTTVVGTAISPRRWAMDPARAGKLVIGTTYGVFGTEDHALSWHELTKRIGGLPAQPLIEALALDPGDSDRIYAGTFNSGILVSEDRGQTWRLAAPNLAVKAIAVDPRPPHDVFAAVGSTNGFGVIVSRDRGTTWNWSLQTREGLTVLAADRQGLFAAGPTNSAPYVVRLHWHHGSYVPSFASYLMDGMVSRLTTSSQGETVLALNPRRAPMDVVIVRIAR